MEVDLLERGPRLRRFAISLVAAIAAGVVVGLIAWNVIEPAEATRPGDWRRGPWRATFFFVALAAVIAYAGVYALLRRRDKRRG